MKKKLKGFTLVELIIVLALFGLIMMSVVQLLNPVTKFFVRSTNFESTSACVDNMKRCIEGNLKYANRVRAYSMYYPYSDSGAALSEKAARQQSLPSDDLKGHVEDFYNNFFADRHIIDSSGIIYVMVFDNYKERDITGFSTLTEFNENRLNSGKITLYKFWFDNNDGNYNNAAGVINSLNTAPHSDTIEWYVNPKLYGNYEYHFSVGTNHSGDPTLKFDLAGNPITVTEEFSPADFVVTIDVQELRKLPDGGLEREKANANAVSSFSMKNVIDDTATFLKSSVDYVTLDMNNAKPAVNRFEQMQVNASLSREDDGSGNLVNLKDTSGHIVALPDADGNASSEYYYFIYTLPETTYND